MNDSPKPFPLAIAQMPITGDARRNGHTIRALMRDAAAQGARLIQFPEGALSGYAKNPIQSWEEVDWTDVKDELNWIMRLAKQLQLWVVLGSAHPLTPPNRPHNSLYIVSDRGELVTRYDKRICSYTETTTFYSPGTEAITFDVDGIRFGCLICIEINFPTLFIEYGELGIDCLLLSSYPLDAFFYTKVRAHAGIHTLWIGLSVPTECAHLMNAGLIGPDGQSVAEVDTEIGLVVASLDPSATQFQIALQHARPWRASALAEFNKGRSIVDARSADRSCL